VPWIFRGGTATGSNYPVNNKGRISGIGKNKIAGSRFVLFLDGTKIMHPFLELDGRTFSGKASKSSYQGEKKEADAFHESKHLLG
jgi:hypothetical protein